MNTFIRNSIQKDAQNIEKMLASFEENISFPNVQVIQDINYLNDGNIRHTLDIYRPKDDKDYPLLVNFHGGGLVLCDKRVNKWLCSKMAEKGYVVCAIDYPLVPDADVYQILRDCTLGVKYVYEHAKDWHALSNKLIISGDSGGGFISYYVCAILNGSKIAQALGLETLHIPISSQILISGLFYSTRIDKNGIFVLKKDFYGKDYKKHPFYPYINPEHIEVVSKQVPTLFVSAQKDFLLNHTTSIEKIVSKYINTKLLVYPNLEHDFVCFSPDTEEANDLINQIDTYIQH